MATLLLSVTTVIFSLLFACTGNLARLIQNVYVDCMGNYSISILIIILIVTLSPRILAFWLTLIYLDLVAKRNEISAKKYFAKFINESIIDVGLFCCVLFILW